MNWKQIFDIIETDIDHEINNFSLFQRIEAVPLALINLQKHILTNYIIA